MNTQVLTLNYLPTDQNTYFNAERTNRYKAAKIKKEETDNVYWACKEQKINHVWGIVKIIFIWHVKNFRKDPDNIAFAKKFILDGLVKAEVLGNDNMRYIMGFEDHFYITGEERVIIHLEPII